MFSTRSSSVISIVERMLIEAAGKHQWRCCVLHFRDCGDYRNRLPRRYHAGETGDIRYFLECLELEGQSGPIVAAILTIIGYSMERFLYWLAPAVLDHHPFGLTLQYRDVPARDSNGQRPRRRQRCAGDAPEGRAGGGHPSPARWRG